MKSPQAAYSSFVRRATASDLPRIAGIQAASPEASQWDPASYLEHDCTVIGASIEGDVILGFLVSRSLLPLGVVPCEREILNLAIDPAARGNGFALQLIQHQLSYWPGTWFLDVRESNTAAIKLYERAGFTAFGRRNQYYSAPTEAGIVMKFVS